MNFVTKNVCRCSFFSILFFCIDQIIKFFVVEYSNVLCGAENFISMQYIENYGGACGINLKNLSINNIFFAIISLFCLIAIIFLSNFYKVFESKFLSLALSMILGGGVGNISDRFFRGFVVDFIKIKFFPFIFNFADICICIGIIMFFLFKINEKSGDSL